MALTGQLRDGPLGRWCAATLTGTAAVAAGVTAQLATARSPIRPGHVTGPDHSAHRSSADLQGSKALEQPPARRVRRHRPEQRGVIG